MNSQSVIEIKSLSGKAYVINGKGGSVLIDTVWPPGWMVVRSLRSKGIALDRISLILITHGHTDHFGNALYLRRKTGACVAIHELDAEGPRKGRNVPLYTQVPFQKVLAMFARRLRTRPFEPDVLLRGEEGDLLEYGVEARWVRTPGHSEGSISILLPDGVAIVGDLVVGRFGSGSRPASPMWVRDRETLRESIRKLLENEPRTILSGHGGPFDVEDVRRVFLGQAVQ